MSQDNQNSQPPFSPEPEENQPQSSVEPKAQPLQKPHQNQPIWKVTIIRFLRGTIGVLETALENLEDTPASVETSHSASLHGWSAVLGKIRSFLPSNLSTLSNTALTGIIVGIVVIMVWTTSTVLSGKPTEVATVPPVEETPPATVTIPPEIEAPSTETPPPVAEITPPETVEEEPPVAEITPPEAVEETTPPPEPTLVLTPEQTLIATIEDQVAQISDRFAADLIQSIQANFLTSSLAVTIGDEWFNLKHSEQDKLLAQILQRSKELDFSHLAIVDSQNKLIARNPVVGTEMVIFQRRAIS